MENQATTGAVQKPGRPLTEQLAALIYYDRTKADKERKQFEQLIPEDQRAYVVEAAKILAMLDKLNKMLVKKRDPKEDTIKHKRNVASLTVIIKDFVKTLRHPKNLINIFPCEELAHRILNTIGE